MAVIFANNASSKLSASITLVATAVAVTAGEGIKFPNPSPGDWFPLTLVNSGGVVEILRCTARTGDVLTVLRAQESTAAFAFSAGDRIELRLTKAALAELPQLSQALTWPQVQTFRSTVVITDDSNDTPELQFRGLSWTTSIDVIGDQFRAFSTNGGPTIFPFQANLASQTLYTFGRQVWDTGNFNPANYLPVNGTAVNAEFLDGVDGAQYLRRGTASFTLGTYFESSSPPSIALISSSGNNENVALTISNAGNVSASAVMQFHRVGEFAAFFGLDTDNKWKVGGRSMGAFAYELWTDLNGGEKAAATIAARGLAEIGTHAFAQNRTGVIVGAGGYVAGSNLRYAWGTGAGGIALPGTWRSLGEVPNNSTTLFVRVS